MPTPLTLRLKQEAIRLGFVACAVARADEDVDARARFQERLDSGRLDGLPWMTRARAVRATAPELLLSQAHSIVTVAAAYERSNPPANDGELRGRVAAYAWGRDYHRVFEARLKALVRCLDEAEPGSRSRLLVDYGPLAERAYAARAGLGWFGRNTNILLPGVGSWVLLGEIVTTVRLDADVPLRRTCGACHRCVDACPTGALVDGYQLDNQRCISYQTIENRGPIPTELRPLIGDWLFGCDLCQEACPVGRHAAPSALEGLRALEVDAGSPPLIPLLQLSEEEFQHRFAGRAVLRAKRDGLLRNACVALGNLRDPAAVPALARALADSSALVRGHAAWALGRFASAEAREALLARLSVEADDWVRGEIEQALSVADGPDGAFVSAPSGGMA
jgi:epoxyqueuosine reductase